MQKRWQEDLAAVKPGETVEVLHDDGAAILQKKDGFRFGTDAVVLAAFAQDHIRYGNGRRGVERMADLGTGTGIIALLMALHTVIPIIHAIELQPDMADMAARSAAGNLLADRLKIHCADLRQADLLLGCGSQDLVVSNPPYQPVGTSLRNNLEPVALARHEIHCTLEDVTNQASRLLRPGGAFCLVHRPERLPEIFGCMRQFGLEPKQLQMVQRSVSAPPSLVLIRGLRGGRPGLQVLAPRMVLPL